MDNVLVTGANGFVGRALAKRLSSERRPGSVVGAVRRSDALIPPGVRRVLVGDLLPITNWGVALQGITAVVHCSARVHDMQEDDCSLLQAYRQVNVSGTLNLARQAAQAGIARFVFVSSIKVNGESTLPGCAFAADDKPVPSGSYGISKLEAEQGLLEISAKTGMEVVIVRPPLVYGPGVKANFATMMKWIDRGIPLPLGSIDNVRSMVAVDNLVDLLLRCLEHPAAAGETFLISDGEDVSVTQLLRRLGKAVNRPVHLLPVPSRFLALTAQLIGKGDVAQRLLGSLRVDMRKTCELLSWEPPISLDEGLRRLMEPIG
jgi:nucleoside-diphosphate-sugar epimerase